MFPSPQTPTRCTTRSSSWTFSALRPLAACPHSPDNVKPVSELGEIKIDQVCIGSCTNSSYVDMMKVAAILKENRRAERVARRRAGSKQVFQMLAANGALADIIAAGARARNAPAGPASGWNSRPTRRACRCAPSTATSPAAAAPRTRAFISSVPRWPPSAPSAASLTDPDDLRRVSARRDAGGVSGQRQYDRAARSSRRRRRRSPSSAGRTSSPFRCRKSCPMRSKRPASSRWATTSPPTISCRPAARFCPTAQTFRICPNSALRSATSFPERAKAAGGGIVVGGSNYGQGSREHAALRAAVSGREGRRRQELCANP